MVLVMREIDITLYVFKNTRRTDILTSSRMKSSLEGNDHEDHNLRLFIMEAMLQSIRQHQTINRLSGALQWLVYNPFFQCIQIEVLGPIESFSVT